MKLARWLRRAPASQSVSSSTVVKSQILLSREQFAGLAIQRSDWMLAMAEGELAPGHDLQCHQSS